MLQHVHPDPHTPARTVLLGARGFVAGAIGAQLARAGAPLLALGAKELDLLAPDAGTALASELRAGDALVVVSALAPCKDADALVKNLEMVRAVCVALERSDVAHVVYVSSDAVYGDCAAPLVESSCADAPSLHGAMHRARELMLVEDSEAHAAILPPAGRLRRIDAPARMPAHASKRRVDTLVGVQCLKSNGRDPFQL